ncbi:flagellin [Planctomycetota bacterium]
MTGISGYGLNPSLSGISSAPMLQGARRSCIATRPKTPSPAAVIATMVGDTFQSEIATDRMIIGNANMAISMIQTYDAGADAIGGALTQMMAVATRMQSETLSPTQQNSARDQYDELLAFINKIAEETKFNNETFLNAEGKTIEIFSDPVDPKLAISLTSANLTLSTSADTLMADPKAALASLRQAADYVLELRAGLGATAANLAQHIEAAQNDILAQSSAYELLGQMPSYSPAQEIANMTLQAEFVLELQSSQADRLLNSSKVRDLLFK